MAADSNRFNILSDILLKARMKGATDADAILTEGSSLSVNWRLGALEDIERSEGADLGLRVFVGDQTASVSTSNFDPAKLDEFVERAVAMAKVAPPDPLTRLADAQDLADTLLFLELDDPMEASEETLIDMARLCEDSARAVPGITNSEGASAGNGRSRVFLAASNGFAGTWSSTSHSLGISVLAGEGAGMERDYEYTSTRHMRDLENPLEVGQRAAERTLKRLNPRKCDTGEFPVIFAPRVGNSLLGHFSGAISGAAVARGTSFLKEAMDTQLFPENIQVVDDPHLLRGLRSKPFDGEGVANPALNLVENGVLQTWLLDTRSAAQLGLKTNGRASRGISGPPSPGSTNLYMKPGVKRPEELVAGIKKGLYVTELIGMGVNGVTGDYSRGASGIWIEDGQFTHAVSEITIASNLKDMYRDLQVANDLNFRYGTNVPTLMVPSMTVAGE